MFGRCWRCTGWTLLHLAVMFTLGTLVWRDLDRGQTSWAAVDLALVAANAWYAESWWTRCQRLTATRS